MTTQELIDQLQEVNNKKKDVVAELIIGGTLHTISGIKEVRDDNDQPVIYLVVQPISLKKP